MTTAPCVLGSIGNTPIVQLRKVVPRRHARVLAKPEWAKPTGSINDRMAAAVIDGAAATFEFEDGGAVVECTAGTAGGSGALRNHKPDLRVAAVELAESAVLSGGPTGSYKIEGIGIGSVPPLWEPDQVDEIVTVSTERTCTGISWKVFLLGPVDFLANVNRAKR